VFTAKVSFIFIEIYFVAVSGVIKVQTPKEVKLRAAYLYFLA
jgi:hypothetical protein